MIEVTIVSLLNLDDELSNLLEIVTGNTKIFPNQVPLKINSPYIVYNTVSEGTNDENLREIVMSFDCVADSYVESKNIRDRLIDILDIQDQIQDAVSDGNYYIYWAKKTGGASYKDPDLDLYHNNCIVEFKYAKTMRRYIDMINKVITWKYTGTLINGDLIVNGFRFLGLSTIKKIELHVRTAPIGDDITVDILKNSVEQSRIATLTDGSLYEITDITDINFSPNDDFGLIIKSIGSTFAGEDMTVVIHYQ